MILHIAWYYMTMHHVASHRIPCFVHLCPMHLAEQLRTCLHVYHAGRWVFRTRLSEDTSILCQTGSSAFSVQIRSMPADSAIRIGWVSGDGDLLVGQSSEAWGYHASRSYGRELSQRWTCLFLVTQFGPRPIPSAWTCLKTLGPMMRQVPCPNIGVTLEGATGMTWRHRPFWLESPWGSMDTLWPTLWRGRHDHCSVARGRDLIYAKWSVVRLGGVMYALVN